MSLAGRCRRRTLAAALVVALGVASAAPARAAGPTVDDPGFSRQWGLERIGAPAAWAISTGRGVTIAIVDSGIDPDHPDLRDKVDGLVDCVGHDDAPGGCVEGQGADDAGHGTHVAGIAAASTGNGQGVAGVAPDARLLAVRVLANVCSPDDGDDDADPECTAEGSEADVAEGIRWAADHGADVINLSLGNVQTALLGPGQLFADALRHAWAQGAVPVLVAGNQLLLPGSLFDVPAVVVAATNRDDQRASYSSGVGSARWALAAPGGEADTGETCQNAPMPNGILSTYYRPADFPGQTGSTYACLAGTSMAAPHVSGALALLISAGLGPQEAVDRLVATADDRGARGRDNSFGSGRINLAGAVAGLPPAGSGSTTEATAGTTATSASPTSATAPETVPTTAAPPDTTGPVPPATAPQAPGGTTADAVAIELGGRSVDDSLPAVPVSVAVLLVVALVSAHGWRHLQGAEWARRTPLR